VRIVLAKCPRAYASHFEENSESLALAYLTASLRRAGFNDVAVLDASLTQVPLPRMIALIATQQCDLIGFTIADSTFLESTYECVTSLRQLRVRGHVVLGGYTPSFQFTDTLEACGGIDSVARFEGEQTIVELGAVFAGWP